MTSKKTVLIFAFISFIIRGLSQVIWAAYTTYSLRWEDFAFGFWSFFLDTSGFGAIWVVSELQKLASSLIAAGVFLYFTRAIYRGQFLNRNISLLLVIFVFLGLLILNSLAWIYVDCQIVLQQERDRFECFQSIMTRTPYI